MPGGFGQQSQMPGGFGQQSPMLGGFAQQAQAQVVDEAVVALPFAQAALWASDLKELRLCDKGIDELETGCPSRPEHGGAGFLSSVFTWRYALNNLRVAIVAAAAGSGGGPAPPEGTAEATLQVLHALDEIMERPVIAVFAEIAQAARHLFDSVTPWLRSQPPVPVVVNPGTHPATPLHYAWPSDGRTTLGQANFELLNGVQMPAIGFGTWKIYPPEAYQAVRWALEAGYRHIDTAEGYANEADIGRAIHDSGIPRQELFIATKASSVPMGMTDAAHTEDIFAAQLQQLGTEYVDVYMLHTPPQDPVLLRTVWATMESLFERGRIRALGISNCDVNDLKAVLSFAKIPPSYIQNLFKVYKPGAQMLSGDADVVALAQANGIAVMGYSIQNAWPHIMPPLSDPLVAAVAARVGRTPSQVLHRWTLQRGVGVIPKSTSQARIRENARLLDFKLGETEMRVLDGLSSLSESGAMMPVRPAQQEDLFGLAVLSAPGGAAATSSEPRPAVPHVPWGTSPEHGSPELLQRTRDQGFSFAAIRSYLIGGTEALSPGQCREKCIQEPRCAAWEVCAPYDPQSGCEGCYLIGEAPPTTISVQGWHAAIERPAR
eukprot:gnl/TRDRNA2_/TRDRNA2_157060_c0_seq1.p1 gnl/TRDRNA2_/TRDRNA2_157060_c0~~gnl/TRDRNA2_/TRDRNA2_157060_c0_seq1.p1  ORF type:complete len:604 (+),score=112.19 gnl/TRDRNA2_/TRDRNA2_157060_c0_seq1:3-1814(+)